MNSLRVYPHPKASLSEAKSRLKSWVACFLRQACLLLHNQRYCWWCSTFVVRKDLPLPCRLTQPAQRDASVLQPRRSPQPPSINVAWSQLAARARGTKERARLGWPFFVREKNILKTMMFRDVTTDLNERKHLKMVIRSVPDSISLFFGRAEWLGLTTLHLSP